MIMTTFILTWSTFSGARTVSPALIRQMRLLGASRIELFSRCVFWACLPFILTGLRTAIPYSLTGAVAGEMIATKMGIGFLRSEEHTSELQSLMRISYADFCLQKQKKTTTYITI